MSTSLKKNELKTTMSCPAQAQECYEIESQSGLIELLKTKRWSPSDLMILGYGSNTIFKSVRQGIVLSNRIFGRELLHEDNEAVYIRFGAGENWHDCVDWALKNNFYGLESLALIPGLMGAAPIQNIGAYGVELADVFESLSCVDIATAEEQECSLNECQFAYRESIFKGEWLGQKMITSVTIKLSKQPKKYKISSLYPALQSQFSVDDEITPHDVFQAVCRVRSSKLPNPDELPNSGSFFKNPVVSAEDYQALQTNFNDIVAFKTGNGYKLAAGWLIEKTGFKGFSQKNGVGCYEKQALVIVNPQHRSGEEVLSFASMVQLSVYEKFGVHLEIEPRVY